MTNGMEHFGNQSEGARGTAAADPRTELLQRLPGALERLAPAVRDLDAAQGKLDDATRTEATAKARVVELQQRLSALRVRAAQVETASRASRLDELLAGTAKTPKQADDRDARQLESDIALLQGALPGLAAVRERAHVEWSVVWQTFRRGVHDLLNTELQKQAGALTEFAVAVRSLRSPRCEAGRLHGDFSKLASSEPPRASDGDRLDFCGPRNGAAEWFGLNILMGPEDGRADGGFEWLGEIAALVRDSGAPAAE